MKKNWKKMKEICEIYKEFEIIQYYIVKNAINISIVSVIVIVVKREL